MKLSFGVSSAILLSISANLAEKWGIHLEIYFASLKAATFLEASLSFGSSIISKLSILSWASKLVPS